MLRAPEINSYFSASINVFIMTSNSKEKNKREKCVNAMMKILSRKS